MEPTASATSNKIKTKIPVYLNHSAKSKGLENRFSRDQPKFNKQVPTTRSNNVAPTRTQERKVPGSLMNATKSSSAKVVPKVRNAIVITKHIFSVFVCVFFME